MKPTILLIFQCLNVHLFVTLTYNFLANHLDKSCLKWDESALGGAGGAGGEEMGQSYWTQKLRNLIFGCP
jgi:hypothetical protein